MTKEKLPTRHVLAYSSGAVATGIFLDPLPMIVIAFYAIHTSVSMAALGTVLLLSRVLDAVTDPMTGILSDKTNTRIGKRKPWMIGGGLLGIFAVYFFFNPPATAGMFYFLLAFNFYYVTRTLISIPYFAWGSEITRDYDERSRIGTYYGIFLLIAQLMFMGLPVLVSSPILPLFDSAEFGPEMVSLIGWVGIIFIPVFIGIAVTMAPAGKHVSTHTESFIKMVRSLRHNKPFWYFLVAKGIAGKHRAWAVASIMHGLLMPVIFLIEPGPDSFFIFLPYAMVIAVMQAPFFMLANPILSDVIDYDILKSGVNRAGNYFSIDSMLLKGVAALAGSIGFWLLAAFHFDPKLAEFTPDAAVGLLFTVGIVPVVFFVAGGIMLWFFPIDARRHSIIKRRIESLAARAELESADAN
jgi:Na+/melibiose symporter-like transporter